MNTPSFSQDWTLLTALLLSLRGICRHFFPHSCQLSAHRRHTPPSAAAANNATITCTFSSSHTRSFTLMIIVQGDFVYKPGKRDEAIAAMTAVAKATQQEAGCIRYNFYAELEDPKTFIVDAEGESLELLNERPSAHNPPAECVAFLWANKVIRESGSVTFKTAESIQR